MRKNPQVLGHWHTSLEGFATSALDFYELVKAGIVRRHNYHRLSARGR